MSIGIIVSKISWLVPGNPGRGGAPGVAHPVLLSPGRPFFFLSGTSPMRHTAYGKVAPSKVGPGPGFVKKRPNALY